MTNKQYELAKNLQLFVRDNDSTNMFKHLTKRDVMLTDDPFIINDLLEAKRKLEFLEDEAYAGHFEQE